MLLKTYRKYCCLTCIKRVKASIKFTYFAYALSSKMESNDILGCRSRIHLGTLSRQTCDISGKLCVHQASKNQNVVFVHDNFCQFCASLRENINMRVCLKVRNYFAVQVSLSDMKNVIYRITKYQSFAQTHQLLVLIQKPRNAIAVYKIKFHVDGYYFSYYF